MCQRPTVSVIVPSFNAESTICRALNSALAQTGCTLDVIVVDDGSSDGTSELLEKYEGRIRVLRQVNAGVSAARNAALDIARGDFVAFLDADDEWVPFKLEKQLRQFCANIDVVYSGAAYVTMTGSPVNARSAYRQGDLLACLADGNFIVTSSVVARARCFHHPKVRFASGLRLGEDYAMWVRLALLHRFAAVREPLVRYQVDFRSDKYSLSDHRAASDYVEQMLAEGLAPTDRRRRLIRCFRANARWNIAVLETRERHYRAAIDAIVRAFLERPLGLRGLLRFLRNAFLLRPGDR
jgi:glycosyltransferase involved in cell wall biosynthesis